MKLFALSLCCALSMTAMATDGYVRMTDTGVAVGVNASGTTIFGYNGRSGDESQQSWLYDVANKTTTPYPDASGTADGQLKWINASTTGVGTFRDPQWSTSVSDGQGGAVEDYPLNTACIWKDGKRISLDHNRWEDPSTFVGQDGTLPNGGNGFYAMKISDDESVIIGYLKAFSYMLPVKWTRNADGTYASTMMYREVGIFYFSWIGASADCSRLILNTSQSGGKSYVWDGDDKPWIFDYSEQGAVIYEPHLTALSPNGRYAIMRCERNGIDAHGVYDFDTNTLKWIPIPEGAASSNWFAANVITDSGDGYICDYNYQLHYFNTDLGINIPFKSYVEAFGSGITVESSAIPSKALVRMISTDGHTICGNNLQTGLEYAGWIVRLPDQQPMLFAMHNCEAMYVSPSRVAVKWDNPTLPEGATISHYIISIDGAETRIDTPTTDAAGKMKAEVECAPGEHAITLYCIAKDKDGKEWCSVKQALEVNISPSTDLFFFENLCDSKVDETVMAYVYTHDTFTAVRSHDSAVLNFRLDAGDFCNLTPFWYTCGFSNAQWDTYLESRWFDASAQTDDFYFTWHERNLPINAVKTLDANNLLVVEYTTDGENWIALHESNGKANNSKWHAQTIDLSFLAGKCFRLRFHAIGAGKYACEWRIDYYGILPASAMYDAPAGLMVTEETANEVKLAWKNNRGEYEVSYNYNSPMTYNTNVGNDGEPLYVACDYGPEKLKAFEGKYITAVSTMLYEPTSVYQSYHTTLQAVIFDQNGKELSRGTLGNDVPWYEEGVSTGMPIHHISLDTPVLIEPGKTYRVSTLITNYNSDMNPIWYFSASDDYIPGVTDLYSDDNLKSWRTISSIFAQTSEEDFNLYGRCIFNIRPSISDEPVVSQVPYCQDQWFYQVYRNGEELPMGIAYYTQQSAIDYDTSDATYTVRSFRRDGSVSQMSAPIDYVSGISDVVADKAEEVKISCDASYLYITGTFDSVAVYNVFGMKVATSRVVDLSLLPHGLYVIVTTADGHRSSVKWMR